MHQVLPPVEEKRRAVTKRRTEITVERHRVLVLSRRRVSAKAWCAPCGKQVRMVTADEAAELSGVSPRIIYRRVEAGSLHFAEANEGRLLICTNSLAPDSRR